MKSDYNQNTTAIIKSVNRDINAFSTDVTNSNIDYSVVDSFGEEWKKFHNFSDREIEIDALHYFDIIDDRMINKNTYAIDLGCGTGRWTKYMKDRVGFMEAIDPSDAIFTADKLIGPADNIRLAKASIDNIPFDDETFDFAMSIGVLHHIPDTQKAMNDCVKKVKIGGYFYAYLYYNFENRGPFFKLLFLFVNSVRKITSRLPMNSKKIVCDMIAVVIYMPLVLFGRCIKLIGLKKIAESLPLSHYQKQTFFWIRTDALDRFGTSLEQRFSKKDIINMMTNAGLSEIKFSDLMPYWHMVGKRII